MSKRKPFLPDDSMVDRPNPATEPSETVKRDWGGTAKPPRSPVESPPADEVEEGSASV